MYLLRHAKSSWDDPGIDDFDRPLNKRGRKASALLAKYFEDQGVRPETILCSPAKRARQTLSSLSPVMVDREATFDRRLYEASRQTLQALLAELPARCGSVLLVGHNPGLQRLALYLVKPVPALPALRLLNDKLPTGGLVTLSAEINDWSRLQMGACTLESFIRPNDLGTDE
ncbi:MAG TPA: histidine phosphatase family protein [Telmatospirillum sp.]|nr:histidine phosphatase family protein [Telmatospirillum sp.]